MGAGSSIISRAPLGARVSYTLSERATTTFTIERRVTGRRSGRRCSTTRRRGRRCSTFKKVSGSFRHSGKQGANSFRFSGRLRGRKLPPGSYRLTGLPVDAAGNRGKPVRATFRIVR